MYISKAMHTAKILASLGLVAFLAGCASSLPPLQLPSKAAGPIEVFQNPILDRTDHTLQHLDDRKQILYAQTYGGGGVGVGLLLGPLGVAANIKAIESNTLKDTALLKNKIKLNPQELFLSAAKKANSPIAASSAPGNLKLHPYLLTEKTEGEKIMMAAVLLGDATEKGSLPAKFLVQIPVSYTIPELSNLTPEQTKKLGDLLEKGFTTLLNRIKTEATAVPASETKVTFVSEFLTPRFKFEIQANLIEANQEFVWFRTMTGVFGVRPQDVSYKAVKK